MIPLSLELERVQPLRRLLAEGPQVQLVVGGGGDERALVDEEARVQHRLAALVPHVRVHARPAQAVLAQETIHIDTQRNSKQNR